MTRTALCKVSQTHDLFIKIIDPLRQSLGLSFGYMIVFEEGEYYTLVEDMQCLYEFINQIDRSNIFCQRNVTNYFDDGYNFTLWPNLPISPAMEIYHKYNMWNGITVSKINESQAELFWFTCKKAGTDWHKFFIRNKRLLLEFINYFESYKKLLSLPTEHTKLDLFKFNQGFEVNITNSDYIQESLNFKELICRLRANNNFLETLQLKHKLSLREAEVLSNICRGFTAKATANKLSISVHSVNTYIERIKEKTGLHFKVELINFYETKVINQLHTHK